MDLVTLVGKRACAGDSPVSLMPAPCSHFPEGSRRQTFPLPPPPLMPSPLCTLSDAFRVPCLWPLLFVASPSGAQWRLLRLGSVCGEGVRAELSAWAPRRLQAGRGSLRAANRDCAQESRLRGALWALPGVAQSEGQDQGQAWSRATSPGGPGDREQMGGSGFPSDTGGLFTSPGSFPHL